jgi:bacterioferritin-associated ferredoxin
MSQIYGHLGVSAQCGRCAHTIKQVMSEMPHCAIGPERDRNEKRH